MMRYAGAIFLGAFLLFLVQPLSARFILPWYGGSPAVWTACMLFFQVGLLGGYLYAHLIASRLTPRVQGLVHLGLLALSLAFLPVVFGFLEPAKSLSPVIGIFLLLMATLGGPYLVVASSGPLLQKWVYIRKPESLPYRFYALSNVGSLAGLLLYPFVVEPWLPLSRQTVVWSVGYGLYVVLGSWCALDLIRAPTGPATETPGPAATERGGRKIAWPERFLWLALAACGSVLLLATTNQMCRNVAVVPFLWILPLSLYLLTFVICFDRERWYDRRVWIPLMLGSFVAVGVVLLIPLGVEIRLQITIYAVNLFICCMVCHGELARAKPSPSQLTSFFLFIAGGGATGGVLVGIVAPALFDGFWEFPLALLLCYTLAAISVLSDTLPRRDSPWYERHARHFWAAGLCILFIALGLHIREEKGGVLAMTRNFYGVLRVYEGYRDSDSWRRYLWHGDISHGCQFMSDALRPYPTHYYGFDTGVALAIQNHPRREEGLRIGVVGLGTGTLAAYGGEKDSMWFYEINREVVRMAEEYFTFLGDTRAQVEVVLGDARTNMESELENHGPRRFDVLVLDAFSSDAIPIHLLTREAFDTYLKHLEPDGVLAVHISNRHFNLGALTRGLARVFSLVALLIVNEEDEAHEIFASDWVLMTVNMEVLTNESIAEAVTPWVLDREEVVWTDDHSPLIGLLRD